MATFLAVEPDEVIERIAAADRSVAMAQDA